MKHALALGALLLAARPSPAAPPVLRPMDVFDLEAAADPQISPDGSRVVYVRHFMDVMKDRRLSNLWIDDEDGGRHRPLTSGPRRDASPRWSPTGDRVAWVSAIDGSNASEPVLLELGRTPSAGPQPDRYPWVQRGPGAVGSEVAESQPRGRARCQT